MATQESNGTSTLAGPTRPGPDLPRPVLAGPALPHNVRPFVLVGLAVMFAGLAGRLLSYPLNRDEHLYIAAAAQLQHGDLYRELGFNHLPNLAYLLSAIYRLTGTEHLLLTGRIVVLLFWLTALASLWLIGRALNAGMLAITVAMVLLMGNVLLLGEPGMLVTNNFLPIPLAFLAFYFLLRGLDETSPSAASSFFAGVCVSLAIGLKANYIFLAPCFALTTLMAPALRPFRERVLRSFVPLALGGLVGGIPTIAYFATDAQAILAHTVRYFTELQPAYWANSTEPQVSTLAAKILLAEDVWVSNASLLAMAGMVALFLIPITTRGISGGLRLFWHWPLLLLLATIAFGSVVAFVPTPSFPQYFVPPMPFVIVAILVMFARLDEAEQAQAVPLLLAIGLLALVASASRILPGLPDLARPSTWSGIKIHREARTLAERANLKGGERVATLSPLLALGAGASIYPEFAAGQFVYRVADYIPPADRQYYRTTSERDLPAFLDANAPAAIIVNSDEPIEQAFLTYAQSRGYREVVRPDGMKPGTMRLFVNPR